MNNTAADGEFQQRVEKLEVLLRDLEACPDSAMRSNALEAVQTLMEFHGTGLSRLIEHIVAAGEAGKSILSSLANDDLVSSLLLLYGLHPADFDSRVRQALDKVAPAVRSHGGSIEVLGIDDGVVRLKVQRSGHGCQSTAGKIKTAIEEAIYEKAPEVTAIQIEGLGPPSGSSGFVPVEHLLGQRARLKIKPGDIHESQPFDGAHACSGH